MITKENNICISFFVIYLISLIIIVTPSYGAGNDSDEIQKKELNSPKITYLDYIYSNNRLFAITDLDDLVTLNISDEGVTPSATILKNVSSITTDNNNEIYAGCYNGEIYRIGKDLKKQELLFYIKEPVFGVFFTGTNKKYAVTGKGVKDLISSKLYIPQHSYNSIKGKNIDKGRPSSAFIDHSENIWAGYNYGEFGGDIFMFDTSKNIFHKTTIDYREIKKEFSKYMAVSEIGVKTTIFDLLSVQSIFQDMDGKVYITASLNYFLYSFGVILEISEFNDIYSAKPLLVFTNSEKTGKLLGPGSFNKFNNEICYYSDTGFRCLTPPPYTRVQDVFFKPELKWNFSRKTPGYDLNVLKFDFVSKDLMIFLTKENGIGVLGKGKVIYDN